MTRWFTFCIFIYFSTVLCSSPSLPTKTLKIDASVLPTLSRTVNLTNVFASNYLPGDSDVKWKWSHAEDHPTSFLRLHLDLEVPSRSHDWRLRITGNSSNYEEWVSEASFESFGRSGSLWTQRIPGQVMNVELRCPTTCTGLRIKLDKYHYEASEPVTRAIVGEDGRVELSTFKGKSQPFFDWGQSIGAILFQTLRRPDGYPER